MTRHFCPGCGETERLAFFECSRDDFDSDEEFKAVAEAPYGCDACGYEVDLFSPLGYGLPDLSAILNGGDSGAAWNEVNIGAVVRLVVAALREETE